MKLSKEIISKIIDWYEEYEDSDNPNNISAEQYISNKLSWENPIDEKELEELVDYWLDDAYCDEGMELERKAAEYGCKIGYCKALEYE